MLKSGFGALGGAPSPWSHLGVSVQEGGITSNNVRQRIISDTRVVPQTPITNTLQQNACCMRFEEQKESDDEPENVGETDLAENFEENEHRHPPVLDGYVSVNKAIEDQLVFKQHIRLPNASIYTGHFLED